MKRYLRSAVMLLAASTMLSGCIFPYWGHHGHDHGRRGHDGYRGDGQRGDGQRGDGQRGGSGRR